MANILISKGILPEFNYNMLKTGQQNVKNSLMYHNAVDPEVDSRNERTILTRTKNNMRRNTNRNKPYLSYYWRSGFLYYDLMIPACNMPGLPHSTTWNLWAERPNPILQNHGFIQLFQISQ